MSNTQTSQTVFQSIMAAAYLDQRIRADDWNFKEGFLIHAGLIDGSLNNPLQTLRLLTMDEGESICEHKLAKLTGLPAHCFTDERLVLSMDLLAPALGICTQAFLASLRNAFYEDRGIEAREDLGAVLEVTAEALRINARLGRTDMDLLLDGGALATEADIALAEAEIAKLQEATEQLEQACAEVQERKAG